MLVKREQNIKETEAWRNPGKWRAKQVVLCLAQHISLLFAAFIVMGWQTTMRGCYRELRLRCWWSWCWPWLLWHWLFTKSLCSVQTARWGLSYSVSGEALQPVLDELSLGSYPVTCGISLKLEWNQELGVGPLLLGKSWAFWRARARVSVRTDHPPDWGVFFRGRAIAGNVHMFGLLGLDVREGCHGAQGFQNVA